MWCKGRMDRFLLFLFNQKLIENCKQFTKKLFSSRETTPDCDQFLSRTLKKVLSPTADVIKIINKREGNKSLQILSKFDKWILNILRKKNVRIVKKSYNKKSKKTTLPWMRRRSSHSACGNSKPKHVQNLHRSGTQIYKKKGTEEI